MESVERRLGLLALAIAFAIVWNGLGFSAYTGLETWELVVFLISMFSFVAALAYVVAALAPTRTVAASLERRERLAYFALVLFAAGLILTAVLASNNAFEAHQHGGLGFGE